MGGWCHGAVISNVFDVSEDLDPDTSKVQTLKSNPDISEPQIFR